MRWKFVLFGLLISLFALSTAENTYRQSHGDQARDAELGVRTLAAKATNVATPGKAKNYMITPKDGKNEKQCSEIETSFKNAKISLVEPLRLRKKKVLLGWRSSMTDAQLKKARKFSNVKSIKQITPLEDGEKLPNSNSQPRNAEKRGLRCKLSTSWDCQPDAHAGLRLHSQPSDIIDLKDIHQYIYKKGSGKGAFIYHIESGVEFDKYPKEFTRVAKKHLLTPGPDGEKPSPANVDSSPAYAHFHSTCTAALAVGQNLGASKGATLIVVKMQRPDVWEFLHALNLILDDIESSKNRWKKSVATFSGEIFKGDNDTPGLDDEIKAKLTYLLKEFNDFDIPLFAAAGNNPKGENRKTVDTYPALLAGPGMPVIVVGAVDSDGKLADFSRTGPQVIAHAMGVKSPCLPENPNDPKSAIRYEDGTSFATPIAAGHAANLLSENPVPFDTKTGTLVENLKKYLQSPKSCWKRKGGTEVLWNGVTSDVYKKMT